MMNRLSIQREESPDMPRYLQSRIGTKSYSFSATPKNKGIFPSLRNGVSLELPAYLIVDKEHVRPKSRWENNQGRASSAYNRTEQAAKEIKKYLKQQKLINLGSISASFRLLKNSQVPMKKFLNYSMREIPSMNSGIQDYHIKENEKNNTRPFLRIPQKKVKVYDCVTNRTHTYNPPILQVPAYSVYKDNYYNLANIPRSFNRKKRGDFNELDNVLSKLLRKNQETKKEERTPQPPRKEGVFTKSVKIMKSRIRDKLRKKLNLSTADRSTTANTKSNSKNKTAHYENYSQDNDYFDASFKQFTRSSRNPQKGIPQYKKNSPVYKSTPMMSKSSTVKNSEELLKPENKSINPQNPDSNQNTVHTNNFLLENYKVHMTPIHEFEEKYLSVQNYERLSKSKEKRKNSEDKDKIRNPLNSLQGFLQITSIKKPTNKLELRIIK